MKIFKIIGGVLALGFVVLIAQDFYAYTQDDKSLTGDILGSKDSKALKQLNGGTLHLPARAKDYPDKDRLAVRFERFEAAA